MRHPTAAGAAIAAGIVVAALCTTVTMGTAWAKTGATRAAPARSVVVKSGDGWWQIAHAHGTTVPKLLAANHATNATPLKVGEHLRLPADAKTPKPAHAAVSRTASKPK
jgi:LysM repeat protein